MRRVTTTTKKHQVVISGKEFLKVHGSVGHQSRPWPATAEVLVRIPQGGCYSGALVELEDLEMQISWSETNVEEEEEDEED
jgi:hypothetical protein